MRINCSSVREKLLKVEAECREFAKILRSLEQFIQAVKGQNNFEFLVLQNAFLTCSLRFLRSNKLEHIRIQIGKNEEKMDLSHIHLAVPKIHCLNQLF